jgi:hypothetical protein
MRTLRALGLVMLGVIGGGAAVVLGGPAAAQIPSTDELNARFAVSKTEFAYLSRGYAASFRFMKDKQTGDCYLAQIPNDRPLAELVKTDDNACIGF